MEASIVPDDTSAFRETTWNLVLVDWGHNVRKIDRSHVVCPSCLAPVTLLDFFDCVMLLLALLFMMSFSRCFYHNYSGVGSCPIIVFLFGRAQVQLEEPFSILPTRVLVTRLGEFGDWMID
jgi:hypothetical protein